MGTLSRTPGAVSSRESTRSTVMADEEAKQKEALNATLKEYISEWRKTREEEELKKLKEKQAKRKEIRAEQEKKLNQPNANSVRCPTVHFHLWRISCCNKYDFSSWYGSNDSDGTINSKEHYFCYNTNVKLCNA